MRRILISGLVMLAAVAGVLYLFRDTLILSYLAAKTPKMTLAAREALIGPGVHLYPPADGAPPYPAVLQFHGCGGMKPSFQEQWAKVANDAGYMAVVVDSYRPRSITRERALKTVCRGKELIGQERAGDVEAALDLARRNPDIDPKRIILAGWSHGAWSVMDFIAMEQSGRSPAGISGERANVPEVAGLILFYPHCGLGAWSRIAPWKQAYPMLGILAGRDSVVDPKACPPIFTRLGSKNAQATFHIYPDADHAFDDPHLPEGWTHLYNAADHADAARRYAAFLGELKH